MINHYKKFELMQFRFSSLAENWGVHAKLYTNTKFSIWIA